MLIECTMIQFCIFYGAKINNIMIEKKKRKETEGKMIKTKPSPAFPVPLNPPPRLHTYIQSILNIVHYGRTLQRTWPHSLLPYYSITPSWYHQPRISNTMTCFVDSPHFVEPL